MRLNLNQKYFLLLTAGIAVFFLLRLPYRTYIYRNHIFDFHIADTAPNFLAVLMFVFLKRWRGATSNNLKLVSGAALGCVFYEYFIQTHVYDATIDHLDVVASVIGAVVAFYTCKALDKAHREVTKA